MESGSVSTVQSRQYSISSKSHGSNQTKGRESRASSVGRITPGTMARPQKALSNIQQVKNAINNVCLAGAHYDVQRTEALKAVESCSCAVLTDPESVPITQFLVLFYHSKSLSFRGIYAVEPYDGKCNRHYSQIKINSYINAELIMHGSDNIKYIMSCFKLRLSNFISLFLLMIFLLFFFLLKSLP